jgi:hypothetical protein
LEFLMNKAFRTYVLQMLGIMSVFPSCQPEQAFDRPSRDCQGFGLPTITLADLKGYYTGQTVRIADALQWEGYVVSSDAASNLFGAVYVQDDPREPTGGLALLIDLSDTHALLPYGSRVAINLQGLYLGQSGGAFELGGAFPSFGNLGVGRLPAAKFHAHFRVLCEEAPKPEPASFSIPELSETALNTLVAIEGVEFVREEVGLPFASPGEQTWRTLEDCFGHSIQVRNSGYSDFHSALLPEGHGRAIGLLSTYRNRYELLLMEASDLFLDQPGCAQQFAPQASDQVLISEIADPDNLPEARFIELFNASDSPIPLRGWELRRYTNANPTPGISVALDGLEIGPGGVVVLSAFPEVFEATYGFAPDMGVAGNGPADSNGDDSIELVDPFGNVVDVFGVPGVDGTGTAHEFEDGRALRNREVLAGSPMFEPGQWVIHNDSGDNGTLLGPRNAPADFNPGVH